MEYDIEKIRGSNKYGVCHADSREIINGFSGDKKKVLKRVAEMNGMTTKEFQKARKQCLFG